MKLFIKRIKNKSGVDITPIPKQANPDDAGYDILATTEPQIKGEFISRPIDELKLWKRIVYIEYGTNLYWKPESQKRGVVIKEGNKFKTSEILEHFHIELFPRSSISKYNLVLANSVPVIDTGYTGQVMLRFKYIFQPEDLVVIPEAGANRVYGIVNQDAIYQNENAIVQLQPRKNVKVDFEVIDELPESVRGAGGFGSSGN
jgi:dUTPase